jgi:G6PDH family F420-dependent oxidoreductase
MTTTPDGDMVRKFRQLGGGDKPVQGGFKGCWAPTEDEGVRIAHRLWANSGVPGELSQVLPSPKHFEQASQLVTKDMVREAFVCGNDPQEHLEMIGKYADAGFDEVYVANMGPEYLAMIRAYGRDVLPQLH